MKIINVYVGEMPYSAVNARLCQLHKMISDATKGSEEFVISPVRSTGIGKISIVNEDDKVCILRGNKGETVLTYKQVIEAVNKLYDK